MIIVSACLAGVNCRYNGTNTAHEAIVKLVGEGKALPVCPEVLGGLSTPRESSEMVWKDGICRVMTKDGEDVTDAFVEGAKKTLEIAMTLGAEEAFLQSRSPSCGYGMVYDGTFSGNLIEGIGLTARLLSEKGIRIKTEKEV